MASPGIGEVSSWGSKQQEALYTHFHASCSALLFLWGMIYGALCPGIQIHTHTQTQKTRLKGNYRGHLVQLLPYSRINITWNICLGDVNRVDTGRADPALGKETVYCTSELFMFTQHVLTKRSPTVHQNVPFQAFTANTPCPYTVTAKINLYLTCATAPIGAVMGPFGEQLANWAHVLSQAFYQMQSTREHWLGFSVFGGF